MAFNTANLGQAVTKKLTTGRLYWQATGVAGFMDFGNVVDYKDDPKIQRVEHMRCSNGFRRLDFSMIKDAGSKKTFTLDEHSVQNIALLMLANQLADVVQTAAPTADEMGFTADGVTFTADMEGTQAVIAAPLFNRAYYLGAQGITIQSALDNNNVALVNGTDYKVGADGMFEVLQSAPAGPWTILFTQIAVTDHQFQMFTNLLSLGKFKYVEYDQFSAIPLATETFSGQVYVTGWGDNKGDKFNEFIIEVITNAPDTRLTRAN